MFLQDKKQSEELLCGSMAHTWKAAGKRLTFSFFATACDVTNNFFPSKGERKAEQWKDDRKRKGSDGPNKVCRQSTFERERESQCDKCFPFLSVVQVKPPGQSH